jgi:hypothetical protein
VEIVYFTLVAIGLYAFAAWALDRVERARGQRFKNRNIIFFVIILVLALLSFELMERLAQTPQAPQTSETPEAPQQPAAPAPGGGAPR